jgi:hypothetical protein
MIRFETYSGYKIRVFSAKTALILWYMNMSENIARRKIIEFNFSDDPDLFLLQITSCIERTYNFVVETNSKLCYENQCLQILNLLYQHGNIMKLKVKNATII